MPIPAVPCHVLSKGASPMQAEPVHQSQNTACVNSSDHMARPLLFQTSHSADRHQYLPSVRPRHPILYGCSMKAFPASRLGLR